jgi:hypothetical protein
MPWPLSSKTRNRMLWGMCNQAGDYTGPSPSLIYTQSGGHVLSDRNDIWAG